MKMEVELLESSELDLIDYQTKIAVIRDSDLFTQSGVRIHIMFANFNEIIVFARTLLEVRYIWHAL